MGFTLSHNKFSVLDNNSFGKFLGLDLSGIEVDDSSSCDENSEKEINSSNSY